jgi:hypothetical protein
MDLGERLRGLGLGKYEGMFRDNKIDADFLPRLTPASRTLVFLLAVPNVALIYH